MTRLFSPAAGVFALSLLMPVAAFPAEPARALRQALKDPAPGIRLRAALALAEARDAEAIPVLIDLLGELPEEKRQTVEECLTRLAGEWAPVLSFPGDDKISRKIRRDAWLAWWNNTNGKALLEALGEHTPTEKTRREIDKLLTQLGSENFGQREAASHQLFALGRVALPGLREAAKHRDAEVAARAKRSIGRIERAPVHRLPSAAIRLLALRKPAGAVEALLAYLPHAEDDNLTEDVQATLAALALRAGKPEPALLHALKAAQAETRAVAAEALIAGGREGRPAVRALLKDKESNVRTRVALALAAGGEREAVAVLIDLLAILPAEQVGTVEAALFQLAGDDAPKEPLGKEAAERKKCRDAWAAWWKGNERQIDLTRLRVQPMLGYTLICDTNRNRVYEIDRNGKERWAIENLQLAGDAVVLPRNRVLIAEYSGNRVTERDFTGKILWSKEKLPGNPINVQRLPNGHTFIATTGGVLEVDRAGTQVFFIQLAGGVQAAYHLRTGGILYLTPQGECVLVDVKGKRLKSFATGYVPMDIGGIDLTPNGRIVYSPQKNSNKVLEFDVSGRKILELNAPQAALVSALPNGHLLVASYQSHRIFELDRAGKVVWERKNAGHVYRARRR